jgi:hypothetical protein
MVLAPPVVLERGSAGVWVAWEPRLADAGVGRGRVECGACEGVSAGLSLTAIVGSGVGAAGWMEIVGGGAASTEIDGMLGMGR